jgi:hypothetical protein
MGSALAEAYLGAGHPTTVWNRTASKAAPVVARGAVHARSVEEAVAASPLVITCLMTYDATLHTLEPAAAASMGRAWSPSTAARPRTLAGPPPGPPATAAVSWTAPSRTSPPPLVRRKPSLYYSGDSSVFREFEATRRVMGGHTIHLGEEADLAALYEMAVGGTLLPALVGFFQGAAVVQARG